MIDANAFPLLFSCNQIADIKFSFGGSLQRTEQKTTPGLVVSFAASSDALGASTFGLLIIGGVL